MPSDLGREKEKDDDNVGVVKPKKIKRDGMLKDTLTEQAIQAQKYFYGNYNLELKHFGRPQGEYANRDFNRKHAEELVEHWSVVGIMFPDKAAVVCAFDVSPLY